MKFSSKILKCQLSPVRKFNPCADQAVAAGRTIYHLNIGQPDVKTPESFYQAVREFREPTLEYAPASGLPAYIDAVRGYYAKLGVKLEREDILATSGGGEALEFIMACILDDGDELLVPEPFYANYNTFTFMSGGVIHPIPTSADNGYRFADRELMTFGAMIVDARHKPTADDCTMAQWYRDAGCPFVVVANKLDKLKKREIESNLLTIRETLELDESVKLIPFSAEKGEGKQELLDLILSKL